ncbi:MAG: hypothetical protein NZ730_06660 [Porticoccaceae bacterium]|nr:hypothetical protein [Porticoccaceae bacterium]
MPTIAYHLKPQGEVLEQYNDCRARNSFICGALGSGKTVQTILKLFDLMTEQAPITDPEHKNYNIRLSRVIACRNTYSELFSTTIKDWLEIHGELGQFKQGNKEPPTHHIRFKLEDGTTVQSEVIFIAFDRPDHVKKARGIQCTWVWLNEAKEHSKAVLDMLDLRHGRYPSNKEGCTPTHHGILGDTNAPDEDHWYYKLAEVERPKDWVFHRQAGGVFKDGGVWVVNPKAENLNNLPEGYYQRGMAGKSDDWIKVNLANEYGFVSAGKPVHPMYTDSVHCESGDWKPSKDIPIVLGFDFGRTPACAFLQRESVGRWICFDEFIAVDAGAVDFAPQLKRYIDANYPDFNFRGWGDPSGSNKNQANNDTPFKILRAIGIPCQPTQSNDPIKRRASLEVPMKEMCMDGKPRFQLLPKASMIRKGLQGGFCYRRIMVSGERYTDEPDKNEYSHPVEALEYALQGEGEGRQALTRQGGFNKPRTAEVAINVF